MFKSVPLLDLTLAVKFKTLSVPFSITSSAVIIDSILIRDVAFDLTSSLMYFTRICALVNFSETVKLMICVTWSMLKSTMFTL